MELSQIKQYEYVNFANNSYKYSFMLSDGQSKEEFGDFREVEGKRVFFVVGNYRYISDNKEYSITYTADTNGNYLINAPCKIRNN